MAEGVSRWQALRLIGRAARAGERRRLGWVEKEEVLLERTASLYYCKNWSFWDKGRIRLWAEGIL